MHHRGLRHLLPCSQTIYEQARTALGLSWAGAGAGPIPSTSAACHSLHSYSQLSFNQEQVIPPAILEELRAVEGDLKRLSNPDGTKRLTFSHDVLSRPIPVHTVEPGLLTIQAHIRAVEGTNRVAWLRKLGRTPIRVQSLWGKHSLQLHIDNRDADKLVRLYGRNGCQARVVALQVTHSQDASKVLGVIRAKPQQVHVSPRRIMIEHVDFLFCPQDRLVKVNVPIKLINDDIAPGVKAGGWMHIAKRAVEYQALGDSIPPFIELDVKHLNLKQVIKVRDLPTPPGTRLPFKDQHLVVVNCTNDVGRD